jgi:Mg2+/citrate symporter
MNCKKQYILVALMLMIFSIIYFSVFAVKEEFTPSIRSMYNPKKREVRLYVEKLKKQATDYVDTLQKTFSWA